METGTGPRLTLAEAARLIYRTVEPTAAQVDRIRDKLKRGHLRGDRTGERVTAESVARYMAGVSTTAKLRQAGLGNPAAAGRGENLDTPALPRPPSGVASVKSRKMLTGVYHEILRDYFAAVILRRATRRKSAAFDRAVVVGQVVVILLPIVLTLLIARAITGETAEQIAVRQWITDHDGRHEIVEWVPTVGQANGSVVRVKYRYFTPSRKAIQTDRKFLVTDGTAAPLIDPDP